MELNCGNDYVIDVSDQGQIVETTARQLFDDQRTAIQNLR